MNHEAEHYIQATSSLQHRARSEPELRELIVQALRTSGIAVDEQVVCAAGAADIVTVRRDAVIEVKLDLTHKAVQMACGQVLLYRQAINYGLWRGSQVNVSVATLEHLAKRLGPAPAAWLQPGDWFRWDSNGRLVWQVKTVAEEVGLNASQLAFTSSLYPQQISLFWEGNNGKYVFVETLARLATALETVDRPFDFGDLFSPRRPKVSKEDP